MVAMSLPARMRASLLGYWQQGRPWQRLGYLVSGALIVVGLGHLVAWLVVGGAWAGPVTFRKPTTFGISFGLTTITLAWVAGQLRISDRTGWLLLVPRWPGADRRPRLRRAGGREPAADRQRRAPFDVGVVAAVLYLLGVALLGMALLTAVRALRGPARA